MKTDPASTNPQPSYAYSNPCQAKAFLVALTVLAYIVAIVGVVFLTTKVVPSNVINPHILIGVGVPSALFLTGFSIYLFRKYEKLSKPAQTATETTTTATSTSQTESVKKPLLLASAKLHHDAKVLDIEIDLNGNLDDLQTIIRGRTGIKNPIIAVDGEILSQTKTSLKAQQVTPTCSIEVYRDMPNSVKIERRNNTPIWFVLKKDETVRALVFRIENRFYLPHSSVELVRMNNSDVLSDELEIQGIQDTVKMFVKEPDKHFKLIYNREEHRLIYSHEDTVETLKKRIGSLTGIYPDQQNLGLPDGTTDRDWVDRLDLGDTITVTKEIKNENR